MPGTETAQAQALPSPAEPELSQARLHAVTGVSSSAAEMLVTTCETEWAGTPGGFRPGELRVGLRLEWVWNTSRPAGCAENAGDPSCSRRVVTLSPKARASRPSARASAQRASASPPAPLVLIRRMGLAVVELGAATCLSENVITWCVTWVLPKVSLHRTSKC